MLRQLPRTLFLFLFICLSACSTLDNQQNPDIPFQEFISGDNSQFGYTKGFTIRDQQEWSRIWQTHTGNPHSTPTAIDFNRDMVIALFLGNQTGGGHSISIKRIRAMPQYLLVDVLIQHPAPGAPTTTALTQPHTFVKLPRSDLPVQFNYY